MLFLVFLSLALCVGFPGTCPRFTAIPGNRAGISQLLQLMQEASQE